MKRLASRFLRMRECWQRNRDCDGCGFFCGPQRIRERFLEQEQKIHFFSFTLKNGNGTVDLGEAADQGTVTARLRVPESFRAGELELYYMEDADREPEQVIGFGESRDYLEFQLVEYGIYIIAAKNYWQLEGEDFYPELQDEGAAADLAAKDAIEFQIPDDESFEQGPYNLTIRVKGYQNYEVAVNGKAQGNLEKPASTGKRRMESLPFGLRWSLPAAIR